jgi:hypothetical protein
MMSKTNDPSTKVEDCYTQSGLGTELPSGDARAQQAKKIPRIGVLLFGTPDTDPNLGAFLRGLRDLGYIEAQNIVFERRRTSGVPAVPRWAACQSRSGVELHLVAFSPNNGALREDKIVTCSQTVIAAEAADWSLGPA